MYIAMIMHIMISSVGILSAITSYPFRRVNASVRLYCVNTQTKISENNRDCTMVFDLRSPRNIISDFLCLLSIALNE